MTNQYPPSSAELDEPRELPLDPQLDPRACVPLYDRTPRQLGEAIRAGEWPRDMDFDRFMARELLPVSNRFWSQLVVTERVCEWLEALDIKSVVDIG